MKEKGITLTEAIIALGIAGVIGVMLVAIIVNSTGLFYKESSLLKQGLGVNDSLAKIRSSIKESSSIAQDYTDSATTYTSSTDQLVLKVPAINSSGDIIANTFDHYIFSLEQQILHFKIFPDQDSNRSLTDQVLSTNVDNIKFQYFDSSTPPLEVPPQTAVKVKITLTLREKAGADFEQITATSEANLRND